VHVLTSTANRSSIESALSAGNIPGLSFTYFGQDTPYHENRLIARGQSWLRYLAWMKESLPQARRLLRDQEFHLIHHVTYSSWRVPSPLWQLKPPFVWGPVGGAGVYPHHLLPKLSLHSAAFEILRSFSNRQASHSFSLRRCIRSAAAVVASNRETFDKLCHLRGHTVGLHRLCPAFFTDAQVAIFRCDPADKPSADPIRLFAGGSIIGSKGLIFALEGLSLAAQQGIKWRLFVGGYGPEVSFLKKRARSLGIDGWINFHVGLSGEDYKKKLKESHIFVLPSFRENAGITMLEAMLAGCVPLIVDASAQAGVVDDSCGIKIPVVNADAISAGLADAVCLLAHNPRRRIAMGRAASALIARSFRENAYVSNINKIYADALERWHTAKAGQH
jgi:glycosyltransferase involved in cell wall biosynthesis